MTWDSGAFPRGLVGLFVLHVALKRLWSCGPPAKGYGQHGAGNAETLVGIVLLDPTGDAASSSLLLAYFNLPEIAGEAKGAMLVFESETGVSTATLERGPISPLRARQ